MHPTRLSPEELLAYNEAFVKSLTALNEAAAAQRNQIIQEVRDALKSGSPAPQPAANVAALTAAAQQAPAAPPAMPAADPAAAGEGADIYGALIQCFSLAWHNALSAQLQANETAIAALTCLLTHLLSGETVPSAS